MLLAYGDATFGGSAMLPASILGFFLKFFPPSPEKSLFTWRKQSSLRTALSNLKLVEGIRRNSAQKEIFLARLFAVNKAHRPNFVP